MNEDTLEQPALLVDPALAAHRPRLVALAGRVAGADAEDVVQEAFLKLASDPVRNRPTVEAAAWLRRVSLNLAINRRRDVDRWRARGERGEAGRPGEPDEPESFLIRREEQELVRSVLDTLSERHQAVLHLRYCGYSYAEIAAVLEIPVSSVGTTLARAEQAFRAAYPSEKP